MRLIKDRSELDLMRRAAKITAEAHVRAMRECRVGAYEYELEAALSHTYRKSGARRHAFEPIVASGANCTVLHYVENDKIINDGDLVLIDAGCEFEYYDADVTRTFPANGRFTAEQRRIYEIVLSAQLAAIEMAKPGNTFNQVHDKACEVLVEGMIECGLLVGDRDKIIEDKSFKRYYPHGTSHWLGMDVHDVGRYHVDGKNRELQAGMVLTVEPGIYVPMYGEHTANEFRGIGIRIEDDVLITADGHEVLTAEIPKTADEIEAICTR
jgi:Xaa-Pro aminopeptidase